MLSMVEALLARAYFVHGPSVALILLPGAGHYWRSQLFGSRRIFHLELVAVHGLAFHRSLSSYRLDTRLAPTPPPRTPGAVTVPHDAAQLCGLLLQRFL